MAQKLKGWHPENIKAELRKRHGTLSSFAESIGVSIQSVSEAISNPNGSPKVEVLIAQDLGVSLHTLWPTRWSAEGLKIDRAEFRRQRRLARAAA